MLTSGQKILIAAIIGTTLVLATALVVFGPMVANNISLPGEKTSETTCTAGALNPFKKNVKIPVDGRNPYAEYNVCGQDGKWHYAGTASTEPAAPETTASTPVVEAAPATCPTEREFEELYGVRADIEREEACTFHWRGDPMTITPEKMCANGWICTNGMASWGGTRQTIVFTGDDNLHTSAIFSATWRLVGEFPAGDAVYDSCAFLAKVQAEGRNSDPQWTAVAGNFSCP
jgi:hypothetical protein